MIAQKFLRLRFFVLGGIASLLMLGLSHLWMPVSAQLPNLSDLSPSSNQQPSIYYIQRGNIHIADVRLDGVPLFQVAAPAANDDADRHNILPIEWRVNEIETRLEGIVHSDFDPEELRVKATTLNDQTAIVVSAQDQEKLLMTVTELDRQINNSSSTLSEFAEMRAEEIEAALLKAHRERQPEYMQQQFSYLFMVLSVTIVSSLLMRQVQRLFKQHWKILNQSPPTESSLDTIEQEDTREGIAEDAIASSPVTEMPLTTLSEWRSFPRLQRWLQRWKWAQLSLSQKRQINLNLRFLLWWGHLSLWVVGSIIALLLFPQTRFAGVWLLFVPIKFVAILVGIGVIKKILDILVIYGLHKWAEHDDSAQSTEQRKALRTPVIIQVYHEVIFFVGIGAGILLFLYVLHPPLTLVVASLVVVGFSSQNLIKDWIGGVIILWEDQYTEGDIVTINDLAGLVERFHLRATQLRTLDGELVTVANGSFTTAINLTYQWSRLNLAIDVAYSTDLDRAMTVIEDVAEKMCCDPVWGEFVIEQPTVLGVDAFGDNSITIRLLIKTQPMKQWDVGREYRRRLKQAFDQAEITIPFPQRSIWFEGIAADTANQHRG